MQPFIARQLKNPQRLSLIALSFPVIHFALTIFPFFTVTWFERTKAGLLFWKATAVLAIVSGLLGIAAYLWWFYQAFKSKKLSDPILWFTISLVVLNIVIVGVFYLPLFRA